MWGCAANMQGCCEHKVVIRDVRLLHAEDVHVKAEYPLLVFQSKFPQRKCTVCATYFCKVSMLRL